MATPTSRGNCTANTKLSALSSIQAANLLQETIQDTSEALSHACSLQEGAMDIPPITTSSSSSTHRFSDPASVLDLTCSREQLVHLQFSSCQGRSLFAHPAFLSAWSGVLRNVLEDVHGVTTPGRSSEEGAGAWGRAEYVTIPLDDADTAAWEDALALMHPSRQLFRMGWDNAARLLLLAHKYDMPAVTAHVEEFLMGTILQPAEQPGSPAATTTTTTSSTGSANGTRISTSTITPSRSAAASSSAAASRTSSGGSSEQQQPRVSTRLAAHLTPGNAVDWLQLSSTCGLDPAADTCISFMLQQQVPLDLTLLASIQPTHANKLLSGLQQQLRQVTDRAAQQEQTLATAALPLRTKSSRARCPLCKVAWYRLPDGKSTPHCFSCGKKRPIVLGELYRSDLQAGSSSSSRGD